MNGRMALSLTAEPSHDVDPNLGLFLQSQVAGDDRKPVYDLPFSAAGEAGLVAAAAARPSPTWVPTRFDAVVEEMQEFLSVLLPSSDAEALQSLRLAFPTVPLADRIAAIRTRFFS